MVSSSIEAKTEKPQPLSNDQGSSEKSVENMANSVENAGIISLILD